MAGFPAMLWGDGSAAIDTALPSTSSRVVDASGTPGDVVVGSGVRAIRCKPALGLSRVTITHPDVTTSSQAIAGYEGNAAASPEATRRPSARCVAGQIIVEQSGGAVADDGPLVVVLEVV